MNLDNIQYINYVKSEEPISINNSQDLPPSIVMQTACVIDRNSSSSFNINALGGTNSILLLYFLDIQQLNMGEISSFSLEINGQPYGKPISLVPNSSMVELPILLDMIQYQLRFSMTLNSSNGIIINAFEYYVIVYTERETNLEDSKCLLSITLYIMLKLKS